MATKYWRSAVTPGSWTTASNWSDISHTGASSTSAPTSVDDCIIPPGVSVAVSTTSATGRSLTISPGAPVTLTGTSTLTITGAITLQSNTIVSLSGTIVFNNTTNDLISINTAGVLLGCSVTFGTNALASYRLESNLNISSSKVCTLSGGTLILNLYTLSCGNFVSTGTPSRNIQFTTDQNNPDLSTSIYLTNTITTAVLNISGSTFNITGPSSFIFTGITASTITSTITNTSTIPINVKVSNLSFNSGTGTYNRTGIIVITAASNFLSLDLSECNGSFLVTSRAFTMYGPIDMGMCINSGIPSGACSITFAARPSNALPNLSLDEAGLPINIEINLRNVTVGDILINGGYYIIPTQASIIDDLTVSSGNLTIDSTFSVASIFTQSGGTVILDSGAIFNVLDSVSHTGGTLKFLSYDSMYVTNSFTAGATGIMDLGTSDNNLSRLYAGNFLGSSTLYTIFCNSYYVRSSLYFPCQICVKGGSGAVSITSSGPAVVGDLGFISVNDVGGSVTFLDSSSKFYYTFAGSSAKVTIGTCNIKGLDTFFESGVITLTTSSTITINGPMVCYNTFSTGTGVIFNLNGTGTQENPDMFFVDATTNARYNINTGYYILDRTNVTTTNIFNIANGATLHTTGLATISCAEFSVSGTLKHSNALTIVLPLASSTTPFTTIGTIKSANGTSGTVRLDYTGTSTAGRSVFGPNTLTSAEDCLNLLENSIFTGSIDTLTIHSNWGNVDTSNKTGSVVFNAAIYGNLNHRTAGGNITFAGNRNTTANCTLTGFSSVNLLTVSKSAGASVSFNHNVFNKPVKVNSGILKLEGINTVTSISAATITVANGATLDIAKNIRILGGATLTVQTGGIVIPNQNTIFIIGTLNGGGAEYYELQVEYSGFTSYINGNNIINTLVLQNRSNTSVSGNNTIETITKFSNGGLETATVTFQDNTENIVNSITGYNIGFTLNMLRSNTGVAKPKIRRVAEIPWELGIGSTLTNVTGATATGTIVDQLNVNGIDFLTGEIMVASQSNKFFLFF